MSPSTYLNYNTNGCLFRRQNKSDHLLQKENTAYKKHSNVIRHDFCCLHLDIAITLISVSTFIIDLMMTVLFL